jgi:LacI family transcriptional regulator
MKRPKTQRSQDRHTPASSRPCDIPHVLLLVETSRAYGRGVIEGVSRYALENGPWMIQFEDRAIDSLPPKWLKYWRCDGIITRTVSLKQARMLRATGLPLVELHGDPRIGIAQVRSDMLVGGRMVVDHFCSNGLRQFAFATYLETWWHRTHREHFCQALAERGFECHVYQAPKSNKIVSTWNENQRPRLIRWLHSLPRPIGIHTPGDLQAVRLLGICRELNLAVPEEIAILGTGDDPVICETVHPTLSSLHFDNNRVGYEAARLLDLKMSGKQAEIVSCIPPSYVAVRQSTDLLAIEDADVIQAVHFIRECACTGISVPRVADEVGISLSVLERRFHQYLGRTPTQEITRVRIERAKTLLARTDQTNQSIARKSGFASLEYFTRVFRHAVGMKPSDYRKTRKLSRDSTDPQS